MLSALNFGGPVRTLSCGEQPIYLVRIIIFELGSKNWGTQRGYYTHRQRLSSRELTRLSPPFNYAQTTGYTEYSAPENNFPHYLCGGA